MSAMVWGGTGPNSYRTKLIFFEEHVKSETYINALQNNHNFDKITETYEKNCIFELDNFSPHTSQETNKYETI